MAEGSGGVAELRNYTGRRTQPYRCFHCLSVDVRRRPKADWVEPDLKVWTGASPFVGDQRHSGSHILARPRQVLGLRSPEGQDCYRGEPIVPETAASCLFLSVCSWLRDEIGFIASLERQSVRRRSLRGRPNYLRASAPLLISPCAAPET